MFKFSRFFQSALLIGGAAYIFVLGSCGGGGGGARLPAPPSGSSPPPNGGTTTPNVATQPGDIGGILKDANGNIISDLEVYLDATGNFVASTTSKGVFLISGVPTGQHSVIFGVEGYEVASFPVNYSGGAPLNLVLQGASRTASQVPGTGTLTGTVTDPNGSGINEVKVIIFDRTGFFLVGLTDASGLYQINDVPAGDYFLLGFKRGYRTHVGQVTIIEGQTTTHDFVMGAQPTGSVNGTVSDSAGNPISQAHVFLLYSERDPNLPAPPAFQTLTDDLGRYSFDVVPAGSADLLVFKSGFEPQARSAEIGPDQVLTENFTLTSASGEVTPPASGGTIEGLVLRAEDDGTLHGTGAQVSLYQGEPSEANPPIRTTESNEAGEFRFVGVAPSGDTPYYLVVEKTRHEALWRGITSTFVAEGEVVQVTIVISPSESIPTPSGTSSLNGKVFGGHGSVAGARVELKRELDGDDLRFETITNPEGSYSFNDIPAGFYEFEVHALGFLELEGELFLNEGENLRDFFLRESVISAEEGGTISGFIFKVEHGRSTSGVDDNSDDGGGDDLNDDNGSSGSDGGDDDIQELEPEDATVKLYLGDPNSGGQLIATTESNEDGFYSFSGLSASGEFPYFIVAEKEENGIHYLGVAQTFLEEGEIVHINVMMNEV